MSSRIEQIIEEIEEYVESCKYQPLSCLLYTSDAADEL